MDGSSRKTSVSFVHIGNGFVKEIQPKDTPSSKVIAYKLLTGAGKTGDQSPNIPV